MGSGDLEMRQIDNLFKNKGIILTSSNTWLKSCVECFRTQCNSYGTKQLLDFVFEQWLLADLREVRSFSLPKECKTLEKFTLIGKHAVQLNFTIDVGNSGYMQLQKIRKPNFGENLNVDSEREHGDGAEKVSGKRALKLEISDGQMTVVGFEYRPIPCLRNPVPGEKALLKGPIECRKGILMLTDKNIEILGGEVDTLLIPNAVSNMLARTLGQPEDPDPYRKQIETAQSDDVYLSNCLDEDNDALIMLAEKVENSISSQQSQTITNTIPTTSLTLNTQSVGGLDLDDDDFDLIAAQTASLAEMQATSQAGQSKEPRSNKRACTPVRTSEKTEAVPQLKNTISTVSTSTNSPDIVEYIDMNDPKRLKKELEQSYGSGRCYMEGHLNGSTLTVTEQNRNLSNKQNLVQASCSSSSFSHHQLEENPTKYKLLNSSLSSSTSSQEILVHANKTKPLNIIASENNVSDREEISPSWMIDDYEEMNSQLGDSEPISDNTEIFYQPYPPRNFPAVRVVRGQIVRLSEKLSLKNDKWCLSAVVSANGLEIEMNFASEVLDKIFGVTATELIARKKDLKTNPAAKEQMNRLLKDSQLRIKNLQCEMVIRFPSVMAKPVIIDVIQK